MKILVDENLSPDWVDLLLLAGIEAVHWSAVGDGDAPDTEIIAFASRHGYVVLTQDLDFGIALATSRMLSPSVIQIRARDVNPNAIGDHVVEAIQQMEAELIAGVLLTIDARNVKRTRARLLPIRPRKEPFSQL